MYYIANSRNSTSTNFIPIAIKIVLVEFVLVETVLVGDPLYMRAEGREKSKKSINGSSRLLDMLLIR